MRRNSNVMVVAGTVVAGAAGASGQCDWDLSPMFGRPGNVGVIRAMQLFDPDGSGAHPMSLVVGGSGIRRAGLEAASGLALFDGSSWSSPGFLTPTETASVSALANYGGKLIVAGTFSQVNGLNTPGIAAWDGTAWTAMGSGVSVGQITTLAVHAGDLYAGGPLFVAGNIGRWNGSGWTPLGTGLASPPYCMASYAGSLYVGGDFTSAGGVPLTANLARWTGSSWQAVGSPNGRVYAMGVRVTNSVNTTHLFIGGEFTQVGGVGGISANRIARYNSVTTPQWAALAGGLPGVCRGLSVRAVGISGFELAATVASGGVCQVHRYSAGAWSALGNSATAGGGAIAQFGGEYVAADTCSASGGVHGWNGTRWRPLGDGIHGSVHALLTEGPDLYVGGEFDWALGSAAGNIGRVSGGVFTPLGLISGGPVRAIARHGGELFIGGGFTAADSAPAFGAARWNGTSWTAASWPAGGFLANDEGVHAMAVHEGSLIAGGYLPPAANVWKWTGTQWTAFGAGLNPDVAVRSVTVHDGVLYAGGEQQLADQSPLARYDAASGSWLPVGVQGPVYNNRYVRAMQSYGGTLYVGGYSLGTSATGRHPLARVVGGMLVPVTEVYDSSGNGSDDRVRSMGIYQGRLHISGDFNAVSGQFATGLAVFDGAMWAPTGPVGITSPGALYEAMAVHEDRLYIGGAPTKAGYHYVHAWSRLSCGASCYANCDESTVAPVLNVDDFTCFINEFAAAQALPQAQQVGHYANCDGSTVAPVLNVDDFTCFINAFAAGCR